MKGKKVEEFVNACWTSHDIQHVFGISPMTVYLWRTTRGLPTMVFHGQSRPCIRFVPGEVLSWARKERIEIKNPPEGV